LHVQVPVTQVEFERQEFPQVPQSRIVLAQSVAQQATAAGQTAPVPVHVQAPAVQTPPAAQYWPQPPQLFWSVSVSVQLSLQSTCVPGQA
jgi:hypothetical protein